ncbi:MAG TPA: alpha/beta fold hydrolase [Candidatus Nitrosocosmicus sp.]|nr:alpha/beta fold hydrolase [Candidatus Nitrosocosmicus sp.]
MRLKNAQGEELDVLVEGNKYSEITVVLVHGFGTDKNESSQYFVDISQHLSHDFRIVRFDFTGYGKSDGIQEEGNFIKHADDLNCIVQWVQTTYPGEVYMIAHSLGCFVATLSSPENISKCVFTGIPNANIQIMINKIRERILLKGGSVNEEGISIYPRSNGEIQRIGPSFWRIFTDLKPVQLIDSFSKKTSLLILKPLQDEITGNEYFEEYKNIKSLTFMEINGDHTFTKNDSRLQLLNHIKNFFSK